jgi:hypothetical protein
LTQKWQTFHEAPRLAECGADVVVVVVVAVVVVVVVVVNVVLVVVVADSKNTFAFNPPFIGVITA